MGFGFGMCCCGGDQEFYVLQVDSTFPLLFEKVGDFAFYSEGHNYFRINDPEPSQTVESFVYAIQLVRINADSIVIQRHVWEDGVPSSPSQFTYQFDDVRLSDIYDSVSGSLRYRDTFTSGVLRASDVSTQKRLDAGEQLYVHTETTEDSFSKSTCIFPDKELISGVRDNARHILPPKLGESGTLVFEMSSTTGEANPACLNFNPNRTVSPAGLRIGIGPGVDGFISGWEGDDRVWLAAVGTMQSSSVPWIPVGEYERNKAVASTIGDVLRIEYEYTATEFRVRHFVNGQRVWTWIPLYTPALAAQRLASMDNFQPRDNISRKLFYGGNVGRGEIANPQGQTFAGVSYATISVNSVGYDAIFAGFDRTYFPTNNLAVSNASASVVTSARWNLEADLPAKIPFTSYGLQWPITATVTGLPDGLSFNGMHIKGTPKTPSSGIATVTATDDNGTVFTTDFNWIVTGNNANWGLTGDSTVEEGGFASYVLSLTSPLENGLTALIDLSVTDQQTTSADYGNFSSAVSAAVAAYTGPGTLSWDGTTLTFTSDGNEMEDLIIELEAIDDTHFEQDERYTVRATNPASTTGANITGTGGVTTIILSNDAP